ncbi:MAG: hypothetical protein RJA44_230 [Pseudomonadota bacterium]
MSPSTSRPAAHPPAPRPTTPLEASRALDRSVQAISGQLTSGLSPISLALAWQDWLMHLSTQPGQLMQLATKAQAQALESAVPTSEAVPTDARFASPAWQQWPWAGMAQAHLQAEQWWNEATAVRGLTRHHSEVVRAFAHQWLDMLSPSNLPFNPDVLEATREQAGANLLHGLQNAFDDWRTEHGLPPLNEPSKQYRPGVEVAVTPGAVVYRNRLIELIQYSPSTAQVQAEPIFIVPSWIMKYYILDLSAQNSMVRWLVGQGHTVFILSWHNPNEADADVGLNDYLQWGVFDALAAIKRQVPGQKVHACGYCLGGTLLSMAAAALARPQQVASAAEQAELASVTLLASETDFTEPGELGILIDESQVQQLEAMMGERGFLTGKQMAGSFQFLHSRDLIWSTRMREYLLGQRSQPNDLMSWNTDVTRMPARMHSQYLRRCYLDNELADGRYEVENRAISLSDIRVPMFVVGTEKDHVSPWKSVYKIHRLTETELTFALANGGHNAGIVSEPGHPRRYYALHTTAATDPWLPPDEWRGVAQRHDGSWWTAWSEWLVARNSGTVAARVIDPASVIEPAPGRYIHECYAD